MGETAKAVCVLVLLIASITAAAAWIDDRPNAMVWSFRIGSSLLAVAALGLILKLQFRADLAHDYLRDYAKQYFNRDGFCFAFAATVVDGIAYLDAIFQNQYENPCLGRIALRPAQGFFMNRAKIETIAYEIELGPAAYGVARLAIPIPGKLQGQRQSFEVGASAYFPDGKGRRLRFQDGLRLRANTNFGDKFGTALTIAGAATGTIVLSKPATVTLNLPTDVAEEIPDSLEPRIKTLWQLGEPPLPPR